MARFTGRSAEKRFSTLCSDRKITCNEPTEDDHGWDHIVEFPHQPVQGVPADMQRPIPAIFVQTKSHQAEGLKVKMKLSNALKLARSPSPCFVILLAKDVDGGSEWYAVHVWEELMGRILKRARQLSRDGVPEDRFHKYSFSFTMTEADLRIGDDLLVWIAETVRSVGRDYAAAKRALHAETEYVGKVSVGPLDSIDQLVDHALGLTPSIPVQSFQLSASKFGVEFPFPVPEGPAAFASMQSNPSAKCDIVMRGPDGSAIEIKGDIIVPGIPGLAEEHFRVRIRTPFFDIVWAVKSGHTDFNVNLNTAIKRSPAELEKAVRLISWAGQGDVDLRATVNDEPFYFAKAQLSAEAGQEFFSELLGPVSAVAKAASHLKAKVPMISADDVMDSAQAYKLHSFLHATETMMNMTLMEGRPFPILDHVVGTGLAEVGDWVFGALQRFPIISQERDGDTVAIKLGEPLLLATYAFEVSDAGALGQVQADFHRHVQSPAVLGIENMPASLNLGNASEAA